MTDAQADSLVNKMAALDVQTATLRQQWIPKFRKVLTGKQSCVVLPIGPSHQPAAGCAICLEHSDGQIEHGATPERFGARIYPEAASSIRC